MRRFQKILCILFCLVLLFVAASCEDGGTIDIPKDTPGPSDDVEIGNWTLIRQKATFSEGSQLRIKFFNGGYGRQWLDAMKEKFEAEYPIVTITLIPSNNEAEFTTLLSTTLDGTPDDIYICHNIPWERLAIQGKIMNLDNVYNSAIYKDEDTGRIIRFEDRIVASSRNSARFWNESAKKYSYYKVPQIHGGGGIAYNKALFDKFGWQIPKTYDELVALCDTISKSGAKNDVGDTIYPFVWSNAVAYMWDSVVFDWWAQLAGLESVHEFLRYEDKNFFNPQHYPYLKQAWTYWYNLVPAHQNWSHPQSLAFDHLQCNMAFAAGQAAMMPATCWTANEIGVDVLEEFGCDIGLMPTPFVSGAKTDDDGNPIRVVFDLAGKDSIIVANKAKNKAVAVEFLTWMAELENSELFPANTNGLLLGMTYDFDKLIEQSNRTWEKDIFSILKTSWRFTIYSSSPMVYLAGTPLSPYPEGNYYGEAYEYYGDPTKPSRTPDTVFNSVWTMIDRDWDMMRAAVGLS